MDESTLGAGNGPDGGGQRLKVLSAEPGSPYELLRILASWVAEAPAQPPEQLGRFH